MPALPSLLLVLSLTVRGEAGRSSGAQCIVDDGGRKCSAHVFESGVVESAARDALENFLDMFSTDRWAPAAEYLGRLTTILRTYYRSHIPPALLSLLDRAEADIHGLDGTNTVLNTDTLTSVATAMLSIHRARLDGVYPRARQLAELCVRWTRTGRTAQDPLILAELVTAQAASGDVAAAEKTLASARTMFGDTPELVHASARVAFVRGRRREAIETLARLVISSPSPMSRIHSLIDPHFEREALISYPSSSRGRYDFRPSPGEIHGMVMAAIRERPRVAASSEAHLLSWGFSENSEFGSVATPRDFVCEQEEGSGSGDDADGLAKTRVDTHYPPPPDPFLAHPRIVVAVPFVTAEKTRLEQVLESWSKRPPCTAGAMLDADIDLLLYFSGTYDNTPAWVHRAAHRFREVHENENCFRRVRVRYANLTLEQSRYEGGWDNTGPNNLLYGLLLDPSIARQYDMVMWHETDVHPVRTGWVSRLVEEAKYPRGFWRKGPQMLPLYGSLSVVSEHHYHMNTAGLYRLDPCFLKLLKRVRAEFPVAPADAALHLFLRSQSRFRNFQRFAHKFHYTDFVQNWIGEWTETQVFDQSPNTFLVHGKHRRRSTA